MSNGKERKKMTKEEFKINLNSNIKISDEDFEKIHTVYQFHPLAETKQDIAKLFEIGGMILINDMFARAAEIGQAEREYLAAKRIYEDAKEKYETLKKA